MIYNSYYRDNAYGFIKKYSNHKFPYCQNSNLSNIIHSTIVFNIGYYKRPDIVRVIANEVVLLLVVLPFMSCSDTLYAMLQ